MKKNRILRNGLLVLAIGLAVSGIVAFVQGEIHLGIFNILWMSCEVLFYRIAKQTEQVAQSHNTIYGFLKYMNDIIEKYGSAIITEDMDGKWEIREYLPTQHKEPSCSAENNDNIEFVHNAEGGKE